MKFAHFHASTTLRNDFPPGFILAGQETGRRFIGFLPDSNGNTLWTEVTKGQGDSHTIHGSIDGPQAIQIQKEWLQKIRNQILPWEKIAAALHLSIRTWQGWESNTAGKRNLPYYQAARIAAIAWEAVCNNEKHPSPRYPKAQRPTPIQRKLENLLPPEDEKLLKKLSKEARNKERHQESLGGRS